jgi:hypothetical protein
MPLIHVLSIFILMSVNIGTFIALVWCKDILLCSINRWYPSIAYYDIELYYTKYQNKNNKIIFIYLF